MRKVGGSVMQVYSLAVESELFNIKQVNSLVMMTIDSSIRHHKAKNEELNSFMKCVNSSIRQVNSLILRKVNSSMKQVNILMLNKVNSSMRQVDNQMQ